MRHFTMQHFGSASGRSTLPSVGDVRVGVDYGPDSSLTGTAVVAVDLDLQGYSQFDSNQICSLDSYYARHGRAAKYNGADVAVIFTGQRSTVEQKAGQTVTTEIVTLLIRRYNGIESPQTGDVLELEDDAGVDRKRYALRHLPNVAYSHLEWELSFHRTKTIARGGTEVLPRGGA